ncbi:MAG TPA: helix-turn-helix domain-containing protein [Veillonellaceae bacterium]|nr:helix-turn-helix domain-containing protein [Veillonellaceae bacterium]
MLNGVMLVEEASVIWKVNYKTLMQCIKGSPLKPLHFDRSECEWIRCMWFVTKQGMERLFGPMPLIDASTALMLVRLSNSVCMLLSIPYYEELEDEILFFPKTYGGGPYAVDRHTGRVRMKFEPWDSDVKHELRDTEELDALEFEILLEPIIGERREKAKKVWKEHLDRAYPKEEKGFFGRLLDKLK